MKDLKNEEEKIKSKDKKGSGEVWGRTVCLFLTMFDLFTGCPLHRENGKIFPGDL